MEHLNENATNEEIIEKVNEIIDYIIKWQISFLESEIHRLKYKIEADKYFEEVILPGIGSRK